MPKVSDRDFKRLDPLQQQQQEQQLLTSDSLPCACHIYRSISVLPYQRLCLKLPSSGIPSVPIVLQEVTQTGSRGVWPGLSSCSCPPNQHPTPPYSIPTPRTTAHYTPYHPTPPQPVHGIPSISIKPTTAIPHPTPHTIVDLHFFFFFFSFFFFFFFTTRKQNLACLTRDPS